MLLEQILCYRSYLVLSFRLNNHVHYTLLSTTVVLYGKVWQNVSQSLHFDIKLHVPSRIFGRQPKPSLLYNVVNFVLVQNSAHIFFLNFILRKKVETFSSAIQYSTESNRMMPIVFIRKWIQHLYLARNSLDLSMFCWQSARFYRCMRYNSGCRLVLHAPHTDVHKTILLYTLEYCESQFNK